MRSELYQSDWVLPIAAPVIEQGVVAVEAGKIAWIGAYDALPDRYAQDKIRRLRGVMLPGLVNAHTHLQYSRFSAIGKSQFRDFGHWCEAFEVAFNAVTDPEDWADAAADGARQALATGTTVFSDVITHDEARGAFNACCGTGIEYLEVIGALDESWADHGRSAFLKRLDAEAPATAGISPHAPYSVDPDVIRDLVKIAHERNMRLHSHLAESVEEEALYQHGGKTILEIYGCLRDQFAMVREGGAGLNAAQLADSLGLLTDKTHIAHGIYLDKAQRDMLLASGTRVALCPRSNATIGLAEAPVAAYLKEGHDICVGTDSLASAPSLDLMDDVAALYGIARHQGYEEPDLAARLITAATAAGARALGLDGAGYGALSAGGPADFAVFDLDAERKDLESTVVQEAAGRCVLTVARGGVMHDVTP